MTSQGTEGWLDDKGRCCGRKPLVYKRPNHYLFCCRCDREFSPDGKQRENWAWRKSIIEGEFVRRGTQP